MIAQLSPSEYEALQLAALAQAELAGNRPGTFCPLPSAEELPLIVACLETRIEILEQHLAKRSSQEMGRDGP